MTEELRKAMREYQRERLSNPEKRKHYNDYMRNYLSNRRANETEEEREARLAKARVKARAKYWQKKHGQYVDERSKK